MESEKERVWRQAEDLDGPDGETRDATRSGSPKRGVIRKTRRRTGTDDSHALLHCIPAAFNRSTKKKNIPILRE
jgi:hypothetical protein